MESIYKAPLAFVSSLFGAPTEQVAEQTSSADTSANPKLPVFEPEVEAIAGKYTGNIHQILKEIDNTPDSELSDEDDLDIHIPWPKKNPLKPKYFQPNPFKDDWDPAACPGRDIPRLVEMEDLKKLDWDPPILEEFYDAEEDIVWYDAPDFPITLQDFIPEDDAETFMETMLNKTKRFVRRMAEIDDVVASLEEITQFDKLKNFVSEKLIDSDFLSGVDLPNIDEIYAWLQELKPMNLGCFYYDLIHSKSAEDRKVILFRMCEMYDIFWTPELHFWKVLLIDIALTFIHFLMGKYQEETGEEVFIHQGTFEPLEGADNNAILGFLREFGIELPDVVDDFVVKVCGLIFGGFLLMTGGKIADFTLNIDSVLKRMKKCASTFKSIKTLSTDLPDVAGTVLNEIASLFGFAYISSGDKEVTQFREDLLKFKIEVFELHQVLKTKPAAILLDQQRLIKINSVMQEMDKLYDRLLKQKVNSAVCKPLLDEIRPIIASINEYVMNTKEQSCTKIEPFMCVLTGGAGIGKSQLVNALSKRVTEMIHERYPDLAQLRPALYMRNSTDKYWSGYTGETYVGYDDFGQTKTDADHADIMQVKNPNRTILNMAALPDKGRCFTSIGIFACANQISVSSSAVVKSLAALGRRFEIHVYCHDPHFADFKRRYGMSPGDYEKSTRRTAMVADAHGNMIPYFDKHNFEHLTLFKCPGDEPRTNANTERIDFQTLAETCFNFFDHYYESYLNSQAPTVPAGVQEAYARVKSEVDYVVNNQYEEIVKETVQEVKKKQQVKEAVNAAWDDGLADRIAQAPRQVKRRRKPDPADEEYKLPTLAEAKAWKAKRPPTEPPPIPPRNDVPIGEIVIEAKGNKLTVVEDNPFVEPKGAWGGCPLPEFVHQTQEEVESSANAYVQYEQKRGITYMLAGDPGAGKSTLAKKVCAELGPERITVVSGYDLGRLTCTTPCLYIEDATVTKEAWQQTEELIMRQEDGHTPYQVIIVTVNPEVLFEWMNPKSEAWKRVERRCQYFSFTFGTKKTSWFRAAEKWTAIDLRNGTPFPICVDLKDVTGAIISEGVLRQAIVDDCLAVNIHQFADVICRAVPYVSRDMYDPSFIVEFKTPMMSSFEVMYNNPAKMAEFVLKGTVKMIKGSVTDGYRIVNQFVGNTGGKPKFSKNLQEFFLLINNSGFSSNIDFICEIRCSDKTCVIMPKRNEPKKINIFLVCEKLEVAEGVFTDGEFAATPSLATTKMYNDYMENAKILAEQLTDKAQDAENKVSNLLGHSKLSAENLWFDRFCKLALFFLKSATAVWTVQQYAKRYVPVYVQERSAAKRAAAKKKSRAKKAVLSAYNIGKYEYDELRQAIDKYCSAAKYKKVAALIEEFGDDPFDEDGTICDDFKAFLFEYESGEKNTPKNEPKLDVIDELLLESQEKIVPKQDPKVEVSPELLLEKKVDKTLQSIEMMAKESFKKMTLASECKEANFVHESALDPAMRSIVALTKANHVDLGSITAGEFSPNVHGLMVANKVGASVLHAVDDQSVARVLINGVPTHFGIKILRKFPKNDLVVFELDSKRAPSFKNILKHFPDKSYDFKKRFNNTHAVLATHDDFTLLRAMKLQAVERIACKNPLTGDSNEVEGISYTGYIAGINSDCPVLTEAGDCGSVLIANDVLITRKILGLHTAAITSHAVSAILCTEFFKGIDSLAYPSQGKLKKKSAEIPAHEVEYRTSTTEKLLGMPVVAKIEKTKHMPTKSKLWNSPIALPNSTQFEPSVLSERDPRNMSSKHPYYVSIEKWNHEQPEIDESEVIDIMEEIGDFYADTIFQRGIATQVLSKTEAINSGKNFAITQLNRDSAPGYPWCNKAQKVRDFLCEKGSSGQAYYGINLDKQCGKDLNNSIDQLIQICRDPFTFPLIAFMGTLKDEPLKLKKIYAVDPDNVESIKQKYGNKWQGAFAPTTRSFAGAPLDYTIASRMYFGTIIGAINSVRDVAPVQIGIDAGGLEWDILMNDLLSCSSVGIDTDFKGWDSTVPAVFKKHLHRIYNRVAQETDPDWKLEDDIIRENLVYAEVHPNIIVNMPDGTMCIVRAPGGEPSGSPRTAPDNSLIHFALHVYVMRKILKQNRMDFCTPVSTIVKMLKPKVYGDDGMFAVHPTLVPFISFSKVAEEYKKIGMQCTPAAKGDTVLEIQDILDLEFLKRKTTRIGKYFFGALLENSMEKMLSYCKGPAHDWFRSQKEIKFHHDDVVATAQSALHEAVLHGKPYYDNLRRHLMKRFVEYGITGSLLTYKEQIVTRELPIPSN